MRRWLVRVVAGIALSLAVSTAGIVESWHSTRTAGEQRLARMMADLNAREAAWRLEPLIAARDAALPPPDRNSMTVVVRARGLIPQGKNSAAYSKQLLWLSELPPNRRPTDEQVRAAVGVHLGLAAALAEARRLRGFPAGGTRVVIAQPNPLDTLLEHTQMTREVAALLQLDTVVRAAQGRPDEALASAHATLNAGRAVGDEPFLISQLVRIAGVSIALLNAERALGGGEPTAGLPELQAGLMDELRTPRLTYALRGERAFGDRLFENIDNGTLSVEALGGLPDPGLVGRINGRLGTSLLRQHIPNNRAVWMELTTAGLEADKQAGPERRAAFAAIIFPPRDQPTGLAHIFAPAYEKVAASDERIRAQLATAVAAVACERHRVATGRWPAALADIPRDVLPGTPTDPFTGRPVLYSRIPGGVVVYSVGADLRDDGGVSISLHGEPGTDVGFRLWNPDQRGLPPLPEKPADGPAP